MDALSQAIRATEVLASFAVALQTIELLLLRRAVADDGIWRWETLRCELAAFPRPAAALFDLLLRYPNFIALLWLQLLAALALGLTSDSLWPVWLAFSTLLVSLRWRGVFNGGSDYMTLVVLSALAVNSLFREVPAVSLGVLLYIAIHCISSYFVAGLVKALRPAWRRGTALPGLLAMSNYQMPAAVRAFTSRRGLATVASWALIVFECSFPLALLDKRLCAAYLCAAIAFHLANFFIFGLNRFLWIWLAAYPAVWYCSGGF